MQRHLMTDIGRILLTIGAVIMVAGLALILIGKTGLPIGRLPGDIVYRGKNTTFYFPIVTCIVVSVVLSLLFWVVGRLHR